ncbi:energy transducer TonB [Polaribacter sp.]|uniref:energy transducer TonB n=1 Tax=Polaribacter sp. TaxID=1920175 RepID=UPI003EF94725
MKKNILIIFTLFYCLVGYSQPPKIVKFNDKFKEYDYYAKPSTTSDLTAFFKTRVDTELLSELKPLGKNDYQRRFFLGFKFLEGKIVDVSTNVNNSKLRKMFVDAFKAYDIEKLNIKNISPLNRYEIQLSSWVDGKSILNCSQYVIIKKFPLYEGCELVASYSEMKKCINKKLENHIINNISNTVLEKSNIKGGLKLNPKFLINSDGSLSKIKIKTASRELSEELHRIIALFPKPITPAMCNGNPTGYFYKGYFNLFVNESDEILPKLSTENELALHFKNHLSEKELQNIPFSKKQDEIKLIFSIDKKGKAVEIKTLNYNANKSSYNKLVSIFKKFPIEKLNINSKDILEWYIYTIITKSNNKTIVECSNTAKVEKTSVFKGCKKSKNPTDLRKCNREKVVAHVSEKFDMNLLNNTKLKGKVRLFCSFSIDTDGSVVDVKVKTPSAYLSNEVKKVLKNVPKAIAPAYQNGKAVKISYKIPITFIVK